MKTVKDKLRRLSSILRSDHKPRIDHQMSELLSKIEDLKMLAGKNAAINSRQLGIVNRLEDVEFKVFSQFGDDGIIQYLVDHVAPESQTFVEFGVESYEEANTRFLLKNNNWKGLILDASESCMAQIKHSDLYWQQDLTAKSSFITRENINALIEEAGMGGPLGLLSIDIDGNDYWVWNAITCVDPAIVVVEYNSVFGAEHPVTIPYDEKFRRSQAHYSNLYWGASLAALCVLGQEKGYAFVGCNRAGNNCYFVRRDRLGGLKEWDAKSGYVESRFRESRDQTGRLNHLSGIDRLREITHLPVYHIEREELVRLGEL